MRKASFQKNHEEFDAWMLIYGELLKRLVEAKRVIRIKYEKLEIVEAFVLRCAVRWELLITADIITSLNRDSSQYGSALGLRLRKHLSYDECKAMLYGPRYLDFKSVDDIINFSKKYLSLTENPFQSITNVSRKKINEFLTIRNFLTHYSDFAKRSYINLMKNTYKYRRAPEPGAFLIAVNNSGQYRWGEYIINFLQASADMLKTVK